MQHRRYGHRGTIERQNPTLAYEPRWDVLWDNGARSTVTWRMLEPLRR